MLSVPVGKVVVVKLAVPPAGALLVAPVPASCTVPRTVEPLFWKVTVPVGANPALSAETVAVSVTGVPASTHGSWLNPRRAQSCDRRNHRDGIRSAGAGLETGVSGKVGHHLISAAG